MAEFDFNSTLTDYPCAEMLKHGFKFYVNQNNVKINSKKDFEKNLKEYMSLNVGG